MKTIGASSTQVRKLNAIASGILPNGKPVIVNANGTVSVISQTGVTQAVGSNAVFEAASTTVTCAAYDAYSNKMVIVFADQDDGSKGKAVVGTISGTSITFGATATWHPNSTASVAIVYHAAAQKVVIVYYDGDNSGYGTSVVGSVSGTNISFGSTVIFNSSNTNGIGLVYDPIAEKVVVAYRDAGAFNRGTAIVGTVSGTNISWGTAVVYNDGATGSTVSCAYDINANKTVLAYKAENNSSYGTAIVGTVSGTSISFGSSVVFETATTDNLWVGYDSSSQKVVISYRDRGNSDFGTAIVGSVSGTSISFGTAAVFEAAATQQTVVIENTAAGFVNIFYRDGGDSNKGKFVTATVSGTSLTFSAVTSLTSGGSSNLRGAYDSTSKQMVFVYKDQANSSYGTAVVVRNAYSSTNLTSENYVGLASNGYPDTAGATIDVKGAISNAVDLNAVNTFAITVANEGSGNRYYIDGTLQATVSLSEGKTYRFDQSDASNSGHPLRLSITSDGTHGGGVEYTTGVTTVGTPGSSGAYTQITVAIGAPTLYYYCSIHSLMGGQANTPDDARLVAGQSYFVQTDGTLNTTAGSPSVFAGTAISTTKMIVKG